MNIYIDMTILYTISDYAKSYKNQQFTIMTSQ